MHFVVYIDQQNRGNNVQQASQYTYYLLLQWLRTHQALLIQSYNSKRTPTQQTASMVFRDFRHWWMGIELLVMFSRHPDIWFPSCHHCFQNIISELHQLRAIVTTVETHMNVSSPRSLSKSFLRRWCLLTETHSREAIENKRLNSTEPN